MAIDPQQLQTAFLAVVECAAHAQRADMVESFAAGNPEFAARLVALLKAHDDPGNLPRFRLDEVPACHDACCPGLLIAGRYRLLNETGEGGMGAVWLAEQIAPVRRRVALKLIKLGIDSRRVLARFEAERQALALMEHPFIAHVFDGGVTEFGRPFFVMEYVDGSPVTEFSDTARFTVRERLRLFLDICQAVQHAHQKGVIHRDLKPSNVLVCRHEDRAVPKVIDFGLAKAMHEPLAEKTHQTAPTVLMGTPRYMSPEQAEFNTDVDTRADVYSLGAILYELLTGTTPLEDQVLKDATWPELVRQIRELEPVRPSSRLKESGQLTALAAARGAAPAAICRELRGDLDWIALKALEKDRARRYQTVGELARDIERYLANLGVEARRPSTLYRFGKFARRNRVVLSTGIIVCVTLLAGTIISAVMAIRAQQAVRLAEAARADEALHRETAERRRVDAEQARAAETEQRQIAQNERNEADKRRVWAETGFRNASYAADVYFAQLFGNKLLKTTALVPLRKELLSSALAFYRQLVDQRENDPAMRLENSRGYFRLGELSGDIGSEGQAIPAIEQAIQYIEQLVRDNPQEVEYWNDIAFMFDRLAAMQQMVGRLGDAQASYQRELEARHKIVQMSPDLSIYQLELGRAYFEFRVLC